MILVWLQKVELKGSLRFFFHTKSHKIVLNFLQMQMKLFQMQMTLLNSKGMQAMKNVIDFFFRKWNFLFRFSSEIKNIAIDPVFSNCVVSMKKVLIKNCFFMGIFCSLRFESF